MKLTITIETDSKMAITDSLREFANFIDKDKLIDKCSLGMGSIRGYVPCIGNRTIGKYTVEHSDKTDAEREMERNDRILANACTKRGY